MFEVTALATVLAIIVAFILQNYVASRARQRDDVCKQNLQMIGRAVDEYYRKHGQYAVTEKELCPAFLPTFPRCPAAGDNTYNGTTTSHPPGYKIYCRGQYHWAVYHHANYPQYTNGEKFLEP